MTSTTVVAARSDGKSLTFNLTGGVWTPDSDVTDKLVQLTSGSTVTGWQYTNAADDSLEPYDSYGNLASIAYREGTVVTLTYATGTGRPTVAAQLLTATDSFGRTLSFGYVNNLLNTLTDPNGGLYTYALSTNTTTGINLLSSVTYPDTYSDSYLYNESTYTGNQNLPSAMTGLIDENQSRYTTTWYGTGGAAIQTAFAGSVGQYSTTNTVDGTGRIVGVSLVDPLGTTTGRTFTSLVRRSRLSSVTRPSASGSSTVTKSLGYDANGNVSQVSAFNGNVSCAVYDQTRNLETGRVEGLVPGSTCPSNIATFSTVAGTVERKVLTQLHPIWHLPAKRAEPLKITTWMYNGDGGAYCAPTTAKVGANPIGVLCSRTEQATTDATGGAGFGATSSGTARVWSYTYDSYGHVLTVTGPHRSGYTDVTTYTYYTCTTGAQCGQVDTVTNQVSQVTTFNSYNAYGQPLTITDPNGVVTMLTYDARARLKSRKVGTETTSYMYWPTGQLKLVTQPDGCTGQYTYDSAHRLTTIADGLGNYIQYTLDAMGNVKGQTAYDSSGVMHRTHTRMFNALSQLYEDINAANTAAVTTTYGYDNNGNPTSIAAPLAHNTAKQYDALNRVDQVTDANNGITKLAYDARNNLSSVIDPRTFTTSYTHDGFDKPTQVVSQDTGTTGLVYDSAGNLKTVTDARGAAVSYGFDNANRLNKIIASDQTVILSYDSGTNGKGRLTSASDANHSMSWTYDANGRLNGKSQTVASITKSVGYTYTNADLTSLVTPSGQTIRYGYTNHRITSIQINSTTLLNGVTYDPFGPPTGWAWGNSSTVSRTFDEDGNSSQIVTAGVTNGYTVDNASRITSLSDSGLSSNTWSFTSYDSLDRIKAASSSGRSRGYTYDANGNRLTATGTTPTTETISTTNNQISSTSGGIVRTYGYDAAGNTTSYTGETFTFNQRGRMSTAVSSVGTTNYVYNALNQLIEKSGNGGTTLLVYDESGHLLGEYSSTGALIEETIWMGDLPVATLQPSGSTVAIYYVHTDHLGSARKVTRPSDNGLMWRWDPDTFGSNTSTPNQNPSGLGTFVYGLRFPGQYYLSESGLFYNSRRTYDPQMGRYLEADPIGLRGGINPYAYASGNPISRFDLLGLCDLSPTPITAQYMYPDPKSDPLYSVPGPVELLAALLFGGPELSAAEGAVAGADSAVNVANGVRLGQQLSLESANSAFTATGELSEGAIQNATQIFEPGTLSNPAIPEGFGKYTTETFASPSGPFQAHIYMNPATGEVFYGLDYKAVFNIAFTP